MVPGGVLVPAIVNEFAVLATMRAVWLYQEPGVNPAMITTSPAAYVLVAVNMVWLPLLRMPVIDTFGELVGT